MRVTGWTLDPARRAELLARFEPAYDRIAADHVTLRAHAPPGEGPPPVPGTARIVGAADDGRGVQALVVEIDGTTARPDGSTYHITWSLADGRKARESNDVIRDRGWEAVEPVGVALEPAVWP